MKTLVILSAENIARLAENELVTLRGYNDGDIMVIMSEECHKNYTEHRDTTLGIYGLRS